MSNKPVDNNNRLESKDSSYYGNVKVGDDTNNVNNTKVDNSRTNNMTLFSASSVIALALIFGIIYYVMKPDQGESSEGSEAQTEEVSKPKQKNTSTSEAKATEPVSEKAQNAAPPKKEINTKKNVPPPLVKPKEAALLYNAGLGVKVAFFESRNLKLIQFQRALKTTFPANSDGFFLPEFASKYGKELGGITINNSENQQLKKILNCICQVKETIDYETEEEEGLTVHTARGEVVLEMLNLRDGNLTVHNFISSGSGMSKTAARKNLDEHLMASEELKILDTQPCQ